MAYNELVKNPEALRTFMRGFYLYGFKGREDYEGKSARTYDDERRRIESLLGSYMGFRRNVSGKVAFLSIDSRRVRRNPLYRIWKAKSFTDSDITLHFLLLDILCSAQAPLSVGDILMTLDREYLHAFSLPMTVDESTVRRKLHEYVKVGILRSHKEGRRVVFSPTRHILQCVGHEGLDFFSEVSPCGVIGSFLLDQLPKREGSIAFKHHYITSALDSDILCCLLCAISGKAFAEITLLRRTAEDPRAFCVLPLQIFISVQSGRQYLAAWVPASKDIKTYRLDSILKVTIGEACEAYDGYRKQLEQRKEHMWGVVCKAEKKGTKHIEFCLCVNEDERHVYQRLLREKRCGKVEWVKVGVLKFSADVYDLQETIPWIRSFICRIVSMQTDDPLFEIAFKRDLAKMYNLYGIGGDADAVQ